MGALALVAMRQRDTSPDQATIALIFGLLIGLSVHFWHATLPFTAIATVLLLGSHFVAPSYSTYMTRNFFGVLNVTESADAGLPSRTRR